MVLGIVRAGSGERDCGRGMRDEADGSLVIDDRQAHYIHARLLLARLSFTLNVSHQYRTRRECDGLVLMVLLGLRLIIVRRTGCARVQAMEAARVKPWSGK